VAAEPREDDRLRLQLEIQRLCEERLGSRSLAFSWCQRSYALRPEDATIEGDLDRLGREVEAWDDLYESYFTAAPGFSDEKAQAERFRRAGRLGTHARGRESSAR